MPPLARLVPLALALLVASPSLAQPPKRDPKVVGDALFREGRRAAEKGDYPTACARFAESQRVDPAPGTLLNLADCSEHLGRLGAAIAYYEQALKQLKPRDERVPFARAQAAELARRRPRLTVRLAPAAKAGTTVTRDGQAIDPEQLGVAVAVDPGEHALAAQAPDGDEARATVQLREGEARTVELRPEPSAAAVAARAAEGRRTTRRIVGYSLGGLGVASLGVGVATGILALGKAGVVKDPAHCTAALACDPVGVKAAEAGGTLSTISTVTVIAGAALAATGAALVITGGAKQPAATLSAGAGPGGAGLSLTGSF